MKKVIIITIISSLYIITSCNTLYRMTPGYITKKCKYNQEIQFVKEIMKNPHKAVEIIKNSEYYDEKITMLELVNITFTQAIRGTKDLDVDDIELINYDTVIYGHIIKEGIIIEVHNNNFRFSFIKMKGKLILERTDYLKMFW